MSTRLAAALALVLAHSAPAQEDLSALSLDALIERLPEVGREGTIVDGRYRLDPACEEMKRRLDAGIVLADDPWRSALLATGALRWRERWPAGVPFAVSAREPAWLGERVLVLDPLRADVELRSVGIGTFLVYRDLCGNPLISSQERDEHQELGTLPPGRQRLAFRLEVLEGDEDAGSWWQFQIWRSRRLGRDEAPSATWLPSRPPRRLASAELALEFEVVASLDEVLPADRSEATRSALARATYALAKGEKPRVALDLRSDPSLAGLARSLELELLRDGEVVESTSIRALSSVWAGLSPELSLSRRRLPAAALLDASERARWRVRIRGNDDDALRDWSARRRWTGVVEIGLAELPER